MSGMLSLRSIHDALKSQDIVPVTKRNILRDQAFTVDA